MAGPDDENIVVRAILTDETSAPADRIRRAYEEMDRRTLALANSTDQLSQSQRSNTQVMAALERRERERNRTLRDQQRVMDELERGNQRRDEQMRREEVQAARNRRATIKNALVLGGLLKVQHLLIKAGTKLDMIAQAATGIATLGAAGMAAVAGLAPLSGALLPLPALLAGIGLYGATAKIALSGLDKAIKAYKSGDITAINEAIKDMGPNAADTASAVAGLAKEFDPIKKLVQEKALDGIGQNIRDIGTKYMPILNTRLGESADGFNKTLKIGMGFLQLPATIDAVNRILGNSVQISTLFGHTLNGVLRGAIHLMDATGPTAIRMMDDISYHVNALSDSIFNNQEKIGAFADRGYSLFKRVLGVLVDLFKGFYNIGKQATGLANDMGMGIERAARAFKDWTASAEGQKKIAQYFRDMKPNIVALVGLAKALGKAFFEVSSSPNFAGLINQLTELVPTITRLVTLADGEFLPAIVSIVDSLSTLAAGMNIFGPIGVILQIIAGALAGIAWAFAALPDWVQSVIGLVVNFGLWYLMLRRLWPLLVLIWNTAAVTALRTAIIAVGAAIWSSIIVPLTTFLFTNPIGWIILAVMALVGVFVLLWNKCEGFRNIVKAIGQWFVDVWNNTLYPTIQKAWTWMKETWDKIWGFIGPLITTIVNWIKSNWETIKAVVGAVITVWIAYFKMVWTVVSFVFGMVWNIIKTAFSAIMAIVMPVIDFIIAGWKLIWPVVQSVINLVVAIFKLGWNIIRLVVNIAITIILGIIKGIIWVVTGVVNLVVTIFRTGWNILVTVVRVVIAIIMAIINFLSPYVMAIVNTIVSVFRIGWNIVSTVVSTVVGVISGIIGSIIDFIQPVIDTVVAIWQTGWDMVSGFVGGAIDGIMGFIDPLVGWIEGVLNRINTIWESVWGGIRDFVMGIINGIKSALDAITSVVSSISNGIGRVADALPGLAVGGPVVSGMKALVGEVGPEAFVSNTGKVTAIGTQGPEIRKFNNPGYVVPNHVLAGYRDASVPTGVMKKLTNAVAAHRENAYSGSVAKSSSLSSNSYMADTGGNGHNFDFRGANFGGTSPSAIKQAVKEAVSEAERNRRERG